MNKRGKYNYRINVGLSFLKNYMKRLESVCVWRIVDIHPLPSCLDLIKQIKKIYMTGLIAMINVSDLLYVCNSIDFFYFLTVLKDVSHGHTPGWQCQDLFSSNSERLHFHTCIDHQLTWTPLIAFGMKIVSDIGGGPIINASSQLKTNAIFDGNKMFITIKAKNDPNALVWV